MINVSASALTRMSARQLKYTRDNGIKRKVTDLMVEGTKNALEASRSVYIEMGGSFKTQKGSPEIKIFFCVDEVKLFSNSAVIIEHKMCKFAPKESYKQTSLIQAAFMKTLVYYSDRLLKTADFIEGDKYELDLSDKSLFGELNFGGQRFGVDCDYKPIMGFFVKKARASLDYASAVAFDNEYFGNTWSILSKHIKYHIINI